MNKKTDKKLTSQEIYSHINYKERLVDYNNWLKKAKELFAAADELKPYIERSWEIMKQDAKEGRYSKGGMKPHSLPPNIQGMYFMLIAFALENLCKAVYILENSDELTALDLFSGGSLPEEIRTHKLKNLVEKVDFNINVSDEDLLTRLAINSMWAGRYPVPTDSSKLKNIEVFSDGKPYLTALFYSHDIQRLDSLIQRIRAHITAKITGK
ncbi:hypothetical protein ACFLTJ_00235 [Chloroflexota bacterium]